MRLPRPQVLAFVRALPEHRLLDRLIRGRIWIPLLGLLLAGIVAMQVEVLKLGASMGRSLQRSTMLQSRNEQLRESVAALADDQRIERLAAAMGMVMPAPPTVSFLSVGNAHNVGQALANIHAANAQSFLSALASSNAAAQAQAGGAVQPSVTAASPATTNAAPASPGASSIAAASPAAGAAAVTQAPVASQPGSSSPSTAPALAPSNTASTAPSTSGGAAIGPGR